MSRENVERLRRAYEDALSGTFKLDLIAPDVVYIQPDEIGGGAGVYHGHEGLRRALREVFEVFKDFRAEPEEFLDLGDQVLAFVRLRARARASGTPIDWEVAHIVTFRGNLVSKWEAFTDRDTALKAVGLSQ